MKKVRIELLYTTAAPPLQAGHEALLDRTLRWAVREGVVAADSSAYRSLAWMRSDVATVLSYPAARGDTQQFISDFIGWYLLLDDALESEHAVGCFDPYLAGFAHPRSPGERTQSSLLQGAVDLGERLSTLSSPSWRRRFCESLRTYYQCGVLPEKLHRTRGTAPSVAEYIELRVDSSGSYPIFDLIEIASGEELPDGAATHPALIMLRRQAAIVISWANDILSFHKERDRQHGPTLPLLLMRQTGLREQRAIEMTAVMHNSEMARYHALKRELESHAALDTPLVRAWVGRLEDVMRGLLEWQLMAARYARGRQVRVEVTEQEASAAW